MIWAALAAASMTACDDGKIYDDAKYDNEGYGFSVTMKGDISGCSDYSDGSPYSVALAAFAEGDDYALVAKPVADGNGEVTLSGISTEAASVELCLINRLRRRVFTYASIPAADTPDSSLVMEVGAADVDAGTTVEEKVFAASCTQCHCATGKAAARLDLMPGNARQSLVGVASTVAEGACRVVPGNAGASLLWQAVATDATSGWAFNHANLLKDKDIDFIEYWINSGTDD